MSIPYRFVPWARRGLARAHGNDDASNGPIATRPRISVGLTLQAKQDGATAAAVSGNVDLTLYGPSDIVGIDPRLVVRTEPKPNATNFEPNYCAVVDFDPPDFPWMLTPARANAGKHLRPWLVLVVVDRATVGVPRLVAGRPLPSISLSTEAVQSELPDLAESWLFAHAQAVSTAGDAAALASELAAAPAKNVSRLVCPRRLEPRRDWVACVVPAFDGGRRRGLGEPVTGATTGPAWTDTAVELPVYYHWEFSTGPVGDIETLARRLRTPKQYAGDTTLIAQLRHIGQRDVAVDGDRLLFSGTTPSTTVFEGAMVSLDFDPPPADATAAQRLADILDGNAARATGTPADAREPTLSPPLYGEHPARRHRVDRANLGGHWLDGLSLQPRYRLAAGWGAEVVRQNQDEFMQAAWEQVGDVLKAERALSLARLSHDVLKRVETRHLAKLSPDRLFAVLGPAQARIRVAPAESLHGRVAATTLPGELFDGAMRRLTSARRPTFRMAQWRTRDVRAATTVAQMGALVATFANATKHVDAIDPNRFVPDGILGSASYDAVPLPDKGATKVDLRPFVGLDIQMTGAELKAIQDANAAARAAAATSRRRPPTMDDVWHRGLLTETHALRFAELQHAADRPLVGDIARLVQQSSVRGTEGVLLAAKGGVVSSQPLRIDARNGALKAYGVGLVAQPRGRARRIEAAQRIGGNTVASVPLQALKRYGNASVFTSLPVGTLGQDRAPVAIGLRRPGDFSLVKAAPIAEQVPTITMPPAAKDHATLLRFSEAFKDYARIAVPSNDLAFTIAPIDFATTVAVAATRARTDPARTVPARLASMLGLGGQPVGFAGGAAAGPLASPFVSARLDTASNLAFVIPRTFDRVMHYPHLLFPLSRKLETLAPETFLPGVGVLPTDFVMAVKTNPRFVEALMVGANHEMGRELLWQGYPTDRRGTPFQRFWQRLDGKDDIEPIHRWRRAPLGAQPGSTEMVVLLFRGQLFERFPTLSIYAYPIKGGEKRPGGSIPPVADDAVDPQDMVAASIELPVLRGHLNRDISYVGFAIEPRDIDKHFFVVEEQMTEPRFGFDEPDPADDQVGDSWLETDWDEVHVKPGRYFGAAKLKTASPAKPPDWLDPHAANVAHALLQRPFRGFWHGADLKMP